MVAKVTRVLMVAHKHDADPVTVALLNHAMMHVVEAVKGLYCADLDLLRKHAVQAMEGTEPGALREAACDTVALIDAAQEFMRYVNRTETNAELVARVITFSSKEQPS